MENKQTKSENPCFTDTKQSPVILIETLIPCVYSNLSKVEKLVLSDICITKRLIDS